MTADALIPVTADTELSASDVQRDAQVTKVLRFMVEEGMGLLEALKQADVAKSTWYRWVESGKVDHLLNEAHRGVKESLRMIFLAESDQVARQVIALALSDDPDVKPADKLRAQRTILLDILGMEPRKEGQGEKMTAEEFLEAAKYEPVTIIMNQVNINNGGDQWDGTSENILEGEVIEDTEASPSQ